MARLILEGLGSFTTAYPESELNRTRYSQCYNIVLNHRPLFAAAAERDHRHFSRTTTKHNRTF